MNKPGELTRSKLARLELLERVVEAALDQPHPTHELVRRLQGYLTFSKHRHRDKSRDRRK